MLFFHWSKTCLMAGILFTSIGGQTIGVIPAENLFRTLIRELHHIRQSLHGIPGRVGSIFQRKGFIFKGGAVFINQLIEGKIFGLTGAYHHRHRFGNQHAVGQYGKGILLAIAKCPGICGKLIVQCASSLAGTTSLNDTALLEFAGYLKRLFRIGLTYKQRNRLHI